MNRQRAARVANARQDSFTGADGKKSYSVGAFANACVCLFDAHAPFPDASAASPGACATSPRAYGTKSYSDDPSSTTHASFSDACAAFSGVWCVLMDACVHFTSLLARVAKAHQLRKKKGVLS